MQNGYSLRNRARKGLRRRKSQSANDSALQLLQRSHKGVQSTENLSGDSGVKVRLDLTKKRLDTLIKAQDLVKNHGKCEFAFADINCNHSMKLKGSKGFISFTSIADLNDKLDMLNNM